VSSETDTDAYHDLIYSKGGYVLQMIRMMLYDMRDKDPDHRFKAMMQDFCKTFENKPASTEDFKAIVEKHMTSSMDLDSNRKMDWFFNQYVYGSGIPQYQFSYTKESTSDGKVRIVGKLVRTGVPDNWKDNVPLYGHQGQGMVRLGFITAFEPVTPFEVVVPAQLERFSVNALEDMLADVRQ
jgi:aminopeptidase N